MKIIVILLSNERKRYISFAANKRWVFLRELSESKTRIGIRYGLVELA